MFHLLISIAAVAPLVHACIGGFLDTETCSIDSDCCSGYYCGRRYKCVNWNFEIGLFVTIALVLLGLCGYDKYTDWRDRRKEKQLGLELEQQQQQQQEGGTTAVRTAEQFGGSYEPVPPYTTTTTTITNQEQNQEPSHVVSK
ncbi:hypothetical protein BDR26DRAFT_891661 [Obelidium mucronatum]|nr:hypothetical protein BDR26DRAFT_891661 [Obelidium mucronatum]